MVSPAHPFEPKSLVLNSNWKSTYTLNRFRLELIAQIKKRLLISDAYLMASALHPTFNALWFLDDEERFDSIKGKLCEEFKQITPKETRQPQAQCEQTSDQEERQVGSSELHKLLKRRREQREIDGPIDDETINELDRYFDDGLKGTMVDPLQ
ncbi:hypothetical protein BGZ51_004013 [Haplosporangium sp. Z 767]|nr:hypothetical protein BGZ51_004013 [Haplosporangium sp. Z 767]